MKKIGIRGVAQVAAVSVLLLAGHGRTAGVSAQRLTPGGDAELLRVDPIDDGLGICVNPTFATNDPSFGRTIVRSGRTNTSFGSNDPSPAQQGRRRAAMPVGGDPIGGDPLRTIRDPNAGFAAVAVDVKRNEVVATDENLFQILSYARTENTPAGAPRSAPTRAIAGDKTQIEFQSGVFVDPESGEIFVTNNDTRNKLAVFAPDANGDVAPVRLLDTPHGAFGITVDNAHQEMLVTIQHDSAIVSYRKLADGHESPIRVLQGHHTGLADPHGITLDPRDDVVFIANYGSTHDVSSSVEKRTGVPSAGTDTGKSNWPLGREWAVPGSGTISSPSIVVHRRADTGDAPPLRVITGPATGLDWPTGLAFDASRRELYVANDAGSSILVFDALAKGNAAPKRVIKGAHTGLANPTSVFVDAANQELWVANFGGHSLTAYPLDAMGDVAPRRTIRSAPPEAPSLMIGNPGAIAFDSTREELLVPN